MAGLGSFVASELDQPNDNESTKNCPISCYNGGTCEIHDPTNEYYCQCPLLDGGGFTGIHCEIPFLECTDDENGIGGSWRCMNGGMCNLGGELDDLCHCLDEFGGPRCEIYLGPINGHFYPKTGMLDDAVDWFSIDAVVIITMASLVLSFVCFMAGFHVGRGKRELVGFDDDLELDLKSMPSMSDEEYSHTVKCMKTEQLEGGNTEPMGDAPPELPEDAQIT